MFKSGFSLIELMVVVAIIAVLAAIAVPAYNSYIAKTQIDQVVTVMSTMVEDLQITYNKTGAFPSAPSFLGIGTQFTTGAVTGGYGSGWITVSVPNLPIIGRILYYYTSDGKAAGVGMLLTSLNISGFVYGSGVDANDAIYFGTRDINGVLTSACGGNNNSADIPISYRPGACSCTNLGLYVNNGNGFLQLGNSGC